jgi:PilZ domain
VSESVVFEGDGRRIDGWSLNLSRGGLRAILDEVVAVGEDFEITLGSDDEPRPGRIVWVREDKGGAIVGVSFLDAEGSVPPPPGDTPLGQPVSG